MRRLIALMAFAVVLAPAVAAQDKPTPSSALDDQLHKASLLYRGGKYDEAIKEYKRAAKMKPDDAQAYWGLTQAYQKVGAYKEVVEAARKVMALTSDKVLVTNAHNLAGVGLTALAEDKRDAGKFREAEQEFQAALALTPDSAIVHYNLGTVLLKEGRDADGAAELKRCLECGPNEKTEKSVHQFLENPRRARENFAPDFALTTLQGDYVSLDDLQGKVVLLDFWATWCPPCREAVGDLQHLYKKYGKEGLTVISVSADSDEQAWRQFVANKKMEWAQYRDSDHKMTSLFHVRVFPTYLVLDGEGIIHRVVVGGGGSQAATIEDEIRKALKTLKPKTEAGARLTRAGTRIQGSPS